MKYCVNCGAENKDDAIFCIKCGYNFNGNDNVKSDISNKSRTAEFVLGLIGGIFGLIGAVFALMFSALGGDEILLLGISALLASIVGIIGSIYVKKDAKKGGIILLISGIWLLISISYMGIIGFVMFIIAGILALVRK